MKVPPAKGAEDVKTIAVTLQQSLSGALHMGWSVPKSICHLGRRKCMHLGKAGSRAHSNPGSCTKVG